MKLSDLDVLLTPPAQPVAGLVTRWGTVTATSPLRVKLDGDDTALPVTPASLVADLKVNDRVWCVLSGRQLTVAGVYGGQPPAPVPRGALWTTSTSLTSGTWGQIAFTNSYLNGGMTYSGGGLEVPTDGWYSISVSVQISDTGWGVIGDLFEIRAYSPTGGPTATAGGPYGPYTRQSATNEGFLTANSIVVAQANIYRTGGVTLEDASLAVTRLG